MIEQPGTASASARIDHLKQRAAGGDQRAVAILLRLVPRDLPPGALRRERDDAIRNLAAQLRSDYPGTTCRGAAVILAAAGRACEGGQKPAGPMFDRMPPADLARLLAEIGDVLAWAPVTKAGGSWPRLRSIIAIIAA